MAVVPLAVVSPQGMPQSSRGVATPPRAGTSCTSIHEYLARRARARTARGPRARGSTRRR